MKILFALYIMHFIIYNAFKHFLAEAFTARIIKEVSATCLCFLKVFSLEQEVTTCLRFVYPQKNT